MWHKIVFVGRLGKDVELRYSPDGKAVASFSLAVNRRHSSNAAAGQPTADFIPCVAWEKLGEIVGNNLVKGSQVLVEGRMQIRNYDAQDGGKRYVTEVIAQDIEFMGSKMQGGQSAGGIGGAGQFGSEVPPDEEIPF